MSRGVGAARPRWAPDAVFARRAGGALVRGPDGEAWVDGRNAHALVRWLASVLDGRSTLDEIWAPLDTGQRRAVAGVVEHLARMGAVRDLDAGPGAPGSARVGVVGGAEPSAALVEHLAELGAGRIECWPGTAGAAVAARMRAACHRWHGGPWDAAELAGCDVVVRLGEALGDAETARLDRACRLAGRPLLPGGLAGGAPVVGPLAGSAGCLACAVAALGTAPPPSAVPALARLGRDLQASAAAMAVVSLLGDPAAGGRIARVVEVLPPRVATREVARPGCRDCQAGERLAVLDPTQAGDLPQLPSSAEGGLLLEGSGGLHEAVLRGAAEPPVPWSWRRPPGVVAMVVSVRDAADPRRDLRLHRALARRGVPWLPVRGGPGEVWIGPRTGPGPGCAACLRLRGLAARPDGWAARQVARRAASHARSCPPRHERRVGALVWSLAAAWAELEAGMGRVPGLRLVVRLGLPGAEPDAAWLAPVPGCPACGGPSGAGSGRELDAADLARRADAPLPFVLVERLVGERAGLVARCRSRPDAGGPPAAEALANVPEAGGRRRRQEWGLGCADTAREARTVAALEAIERSCAAPRGRTILRASAAELGEEAIDPALLVLHGDEQYARPGFPFAPLDPREEVEWTWAYSLAQRRHVAVPADLVFYRGRRRPAGRRPLACNSSSGCAVGQGAGQAALHAVLEVLERDGLLLTWYGRRPPPRLDPDRAEDRRIPLLRAQLDARGYDVAVFDTTPPDIGVPCVWAMAVNRTDDGLKTLSGAGCHPDPERAVLRALREVSAHLGPMRALAAAAGRRTAPRRLEGGRALRRPRDHVLLYGLPEAFGRLRFLFESEPSGLSPRQHFRRRGAAVVTEPSGWAPAVQAAILHAGLDLLVADMTASDVRGLGLVAVRALVPGTLPMTFGGGLERTAGAARLAAPPGPLLPHPLG